MIWKITTGSQLKVVNLVKVIRVSFTQVYTKSIIDGHEYQYHRSYFLQNRKPATLEDIQKYTFKV